MKQKEKSKSTLYTCSICYQAKNKLIKLKKTNRRICTTCYDTHKEAIKQGKK